MRMIKYLLYCCRWKEAKTDFTESVECLIFLYDMIMFDFYLPHQITVLLDSVILNRIRYFIDENKCIWGLSKSEMMAFRQIGTNTKQFYVQIKSNIQTSIDWRRENMNCTLDIILDYFKLELQKAYMQIGNMYIECNFHTQYPQNHWWNINF